LQRKSADCSFGGFNYSIEAGRIGNGDFAEHLAVQLDFGLFEAIDELAVPYTALAAGSAQTYNPKASEIAFSPFAVDSGIDSRSYGGFFCKTVISAGRAAMALYGP